MSDIQIGIIGFGRIGAKHAEWIEQANGIRVVAVYDPTEARREIARQRGLVAIESADRMPDVDAMLIATPTSMHFDDAHRALKAGKHVMVEKPMTLDAPQAQVLVGLAKSCGKTLSVFHNRRWDSDYLTLKSAIESGTLGKAFNVESRLGQWASCVGPAAREWRPNWRNESSFGGGGLYDWGSHFIDQLWRLMLPAKPVQVFAQLRGNVWTRDCDDFARILINFDNGATGLVEINTTTTRPLPRWHVDAANGSMQAPPSFAYRTDEWAAFTFTPAADPSQSINFPRVTGLSPVQIWEQFARACRGEGDPAVTAESVVPTMTLLDAARQSSRSGLAVQIGG